MTQPDPNAQSGVTEPQSGAGEGQGETGTGDAAPQGGEGTQTTGQPVVDPKDAEIANLRARMQAADKRASERESELRQIKDKDLPAIDRLTRDNAELTQQLETARTENRTLRITNAFLADNTYDWHDAKAAQQMLDASKLDVDDNGNVTGLKVALDALAKSSPWMIKPKTDAQQQVQQVGVPPLNAGGGSRNDGKATKDEMAKRFPVLKTRLGQ